MIIYLEGPDGSGKTTLANAIAKFCDSKDFVYERDAEKRISTHPTRPDRVDKATLFDRLEEMLADGVVHILDRGPISDSIYRMFDDYKPVAKLEDYLKLFKQYRNNIIIVYTRTEHAEEAMLARGDDNPVAIRHHKELTKAYDLLMGIIKYNLPTRCRKFDYTVENATKDVLTDLECMVEVFNGNKTR